ncbi:transcriptional regulator [Enterobacter quasiroggenkampii]|uniref:transcriptional regulator n=1 Tax=Enterobacter quasiroggenkampii TaxID=2497436 RepID=UPI0039C2E79B
MNTRDKILNHLQNNIPTSAAQLSKLFGCHKSHINLLLHALVTDGLVEVDSVRKGANFYRLTALHNQRIEAIHRYLEEHETGMAVEIASATGIPKNLVTKTLKGLAARGELHRDWCHKNAWVYSKKSVFNFGSANPLTAFINKALREVRAS